MIVKLIPFYILLLLFWSGISFSQKVKRTDRIVMGGSQVNLEMNYKALEAKYPVAFMLVVENRLIRFKSGIEVELFSAEKQENDYGRMLSHDFINHMGSEPVYPWYWVLSGNGEFID